MFCLELVALVERKERSLMLRIHTQSIYEGQSV